MIVQTRPRFTGGFILRQEMLNALSIAAFDFGEMLHADYADGILSGCHLSTTDKIITVGPGVILFGGQFCLLKESMSIPYSPSDMLCICKLCFSEEYRTTTSTYREVELILADTLDVRSSEIEVCRFRLQSEAKLRYLYDDFEDRSTEYDTLNTIHAPHAAFGGSSTLSLEIIHAYAREMMAVSSTEMLDQLFCVQALSAHSALPQEAIAAYIHLRTNQTIEKSSNLILYQGLVNILKGVKQGINLHENKPGQARRRMMLD